MDISKQFLLAMALAGTSMSFAANLQVQLNLLDSTSDSNDLNVELTITNQDSDTVQLLKWYLAPQNKLQSNVFSVTVDGLPVQYTGPIVKRPTPTDEDYITLEAGQSITQTLALSSFYNMIESGNYQATYSATSIDLIKSSFKTKGAVQTPQTLNSNPVNAWLKGIDKKSLNLQPASTAPSAKSSGSITYLGACTNSQKTDINHGVSAAQDIANTAYDYLLDNNYIADQSTRYKTWFGAYTDSRYTTVTDHFSKISDALSNQNIQMDCDCMEELKSAYAYVYQDEPYRIHVCDSFWAAPTSGTDSKAGTLVHEMSHFHVNGSTSDHAYGQYSAERLAKSDPNKAIMNADSHEYFAENTPYLN